MSDKTDLTAAIALIGNGSWAENEIYGFLNREERAAVTIILNAVVSGDLVPAARRPTVAGGNGSAVRGR